MRAPIVFSVPDKEGLRERTPRTFTNLVKAGYFPAERTLIALGDGRFSTTLTTPEFYEFARMLGVRSVLHDGGAK